VGAQLGVGRSRVYELAAGGLLPVFRLGRRLYFPRRGLEALADAAIARASVRLDPADDVVTDRRAWGPPTGSDAEGRWPVADAGRARRRHPV
jgi:hypothetical protein